MPVVVVVVAAVVVVVWTFVGWLEVVVELFETVRSSCVTGGVGLEVLECGLREWEGLLLVRAVLEEWAAGDVE